MANAKNGWLRPSLAALVLLGAASIAQATHFRYGNLTWVPGSGRTVDFQLTDAFRRTATPSFDPCVSPSNTATVIACTGPGPKFCANGGSVGASCTTNATCGGGTTVCSPLHGVGDVIREDIGGTQLDFGDGSHTPAGTAPLVYVVTSIDTVNQWSFVKALDPASLPAIDTDITHTYGAGTSFTAQVNDCCRISAAVSPNGHINNPDKGYTLSTNVTFTGNNCPVSTQIPIVTCPINAICNFMVPASDVNGDTLRWRLATSSEANVNNLLNSSTDNVNGVFRQPGPPNATNAATINANTGVYTWNTTGATLAGGSLNTLYSTQVIIEDLTGPSGTVKCRTAVDFLIQLVPQVNNPPVCTVTSPQTVLAGNNLTFGVSASDPDSGDTVTLTAAGLPVGATMTPSLPTSGNPVSSTFSWTPGAGDVGTFVVQYAATDQVNQQDLCSVTINVLCNVGLCGDGNGCTDDACGVNALAPTRTTPPSVAPRRACVTSPSLLQRELPGRRVRVVGDGLPRLAAASATWRRPAPGTARPVRPTPRARRRVVRSAGVCDVAESCDGVDDNCPARRLPSRRRRSAAPRPASATCRELYRARAPCARPTASNRAAVVVPRLGRASATWPRTARGRARLPGRRLRQSSGRCAARRRASAT